MCIRDRISTGRIIVAPWGAVHRLLWWCASVPERNIANLWHRTRAWSCHQAPEKGMLLIHSTAVEKRRAYETVRKPELGLHQHTRWEDRKRSLMTSDYLPLTFDASAVRKMQVHRQGRRDPCLYTFCSQEFLLYFSFSVSTLQRVQGTFLSGHFQLPSLFGVFCPD